MQTWTLGETFSEESLNYSYQGYRQGLFPSLINCQELSNLFKSQLGSYSTHLLNYMYIVKKHKTLNDILHTPRDIHLCMPSTCTGKWELSECYNGAIPQIPILVDCNKEYLNSIYQYIQMITQNIITCV